MTRSTVPALTAATAVLALAACGGGGSGGGATSILPSAGSPPTVSTPGSGMVEGRAALDGAVAAENNVSVLKTLNHITTIGSAVDPVTGDVNPYGLDVAKVSAGKIEAGDLVVCDFNDRENVQGTGNAIIALHPKPGSVPTHIVDDRSLLGCTEVALAPNGNIWASAFAANDNPIFTPAGSLLTTLPGGPFHGPFGQVFAPHSGPGGTIAAFYESNASDGSIVRINVKPGPKFTFDVIAMGFAVNHGAPGSILGPSGLQYDAASDHLYIVDGASNTLVAFNDASKIPAAGIVVHGTSFSGPFAGHARVVFSGPPLNGPISSALLPDGHLVLGNTLNANGENLMVEITPRGRLLDVKNVDTGAAGALFGMVATGHSDADTNIYFNDDNDNTVKVLTR